MRREYFKHARPFAHLGVSRSHRLFSEAGLFILSHESLLLCAIRRWLYLRTMTGGGITALTNRKGKKMSTSDGQVKPQDYWSNMSTFVCGTCMYCVQKRKGEGGYGRCRRHAPVIGQGWPVIKSDDWCGDHKIDERKL